jgi:hypothetical protein
LTESSNSASVPRGAGSATTGGRGLGATSLALGLLAAAGSVLLGLRLLVPGTLAFPTPVRAALGTAAVTPPLSGVTAAVLGAVALALRRPGTAPAVTGLALGAAGLLPWGTTTLVFIAQTPI